MSREYPDRPIVGVGGVVVNRDRVLLVRRGRPPLLGEWSIPGGTVELGETLSEAVRREMTEETGLRIDPVEVLAVIDRIIPDAEGRPQYHYVLVDYLCQVVDGEPAAASDVTACCWASRQELASFGLHPETLRVVESAFERGTVERGTVEQK